MLRLTLMLSAAIYAGLVIYSDGYVPPGADSDAVAARAASDPAPRLIDAQTTPEEFTTADGEVLQIAAVINPAAMSGGPGEVARVSTRASGAIVLADAVAPPLLEVTGSRVNLRAGPSTGNAVIGALQQGQQAELITSLGNGWAHIRAVATGTEGYMADRFLAPVN